MSLKSEKAHMRPDQLKLLDALGRLHTTVAPDRKLWVTAKIDFRILDYFGIDKLTALPDDRHNATRSCATTQRRQPISSRHGCRYRLKAMGRSSLQVRPDWTCGPGVPQALEFA